MLGIEPALPHADVDVTQRHLSFSAGERRLPNDHLTCPGGERRVSPEHAQIAETDLGAAHRHLGQQYHLYASGRLFTGKPGGKDARIQHERGGEVEEATAQPAVPAIGWASHPHQLPLAIRPGVPMARPGPESHSTLLRQFAPVILSPGGGSLFPGA